MSEDKKDQNQTTTTNKEVVSMRQLLECGVHFGHQTKRWNPQMKRYIFTSRNGIHVIDLQQTLKLAKKAYQVVKDVASRNGTILFVGTKKQAQEPIEFEANRCGMPFISHRWLGGTLTNSVTLRKSVNKYKKLIQMEESGVLQKLSNKEASRKRKTLTRLRYYLDGIKDLVGNPTLVFIVDTQREQLAVNEANKLNIPIVGVVDTNADPNEVQFPIPANDDAIRAIKLLCSIVSQAVIDGREEAGLTGKAGEDKAIEEELMARHEALQSKDLNLEDDSDDDVKEDKKAPAKKSKPSKSEDESSDDEAEKKKAAKKVPSVKKEVKESKAVSSTTEKKAPAKKAPAKTTKKEIAS